MPRIHVKWHFILAIFILGSLAALLLTVRGRPTAEKSGEPKLADVPTLAKSENSATDELRPAPRTIEEVEPEPARKIIEARIEKGETASQLLGSYLSPGEIHDLVGQCRLVYPLSRLDAGQDYRLTLFGGNFKRFEYDIDTEKQLVICRQGEGFTVSLEPIVYKTVQKVVRGTIDTNFFDAMTTSGEQPELALALADIFAWDIDFIRDVRQGDTFQVLIEKRSRKGKPAGYGNILAAEFVNQGVPYQAFRFVHDGVISYYDAEGNNVRKAFLKAPLSFTRISSGFSLHRFHPITKTWKAHPAIDYAARPGTPIKTVGDGTIIKIGYNKYNGNFIKIRHNGSYQTIYLHMRRFAKGMTRGKKLTQGQVIGYVGSTGLATGPHL